MKFSLTQSGNIVAFLGTLFGIFGVDVTPEALQGFFAVLAGLGTVGGIMLSWFGRWRKGDLNIVGTRK